MNDDKYMTSFEMISEAGDAKGKAMQAIDMLQEYEFEKAEELLAEAKKSLINAHQLQTDLIRQEIAGDSVKINILAVHAQDHFSMATTAIDLAEKMMKLYRKLYLIEKGENNG